MREIKRLILHHTATPQDTTVESIRNYHVNDRGWSDIGYHYLVDYTGKIHDGRPEKRKGAHAGIHNEGSLAIAVIGNYEETELTVRSCRALMELLGYLEYKYSQFVVGDIEVIGHKDVSNTLCPGKDLYEWLQWWRYGRKWGLL